MAGKESSDQGKKHLWETHNAGVGVGGGKEAGEGGRDHICLEGGSGKGRGGISLRVIKSKCGSNSRGQRRRETSVHSGEGAG